MNKHPIIPVSDRVLLEFFLEEYGEMQDGIVIPESSRKALKESKPKYRWVKILAAGGGCLQVKPGQEALVHEAEVQQIVVPGVSSICFIREAQIHMVRDAQPAPQNPPVG